MNPLGNVDSQQRDSQDQLRSALWGLPLRSPNGSVTVRICCHQDGRRRSICYQSNSLPPCLPMRNNLTALSQIWNLYFVAFSDQIHVFEPCFPSQLAPLTPLLIFAIPPSAAGLTGYIEPTKPQAANYIVIRQLGREEILLISCDGGDVLAYSIRSILQASHRRWTAGYEGAASKPTAFFHENVGASAWGIDVHTEARLIAVSSNTHEIVIFAFALLENSSQDLGIKKSHDKSVSSNEHCQGKGSNKQSEPRRSLCAKPPKSLSKAWQYPGHLTATLDRSRQNYAWALKEHTTNIPAVSFMNHKPPENSGSVVLASTDIHGRTLVWNVYTGQWFKFQNPHARGWGVQCLDGRSARIATSEEEAFGCRISPTVYPEYPRHCYENSEGTSQVPNNSSWHPAYASIALTATEAAGLGLFQNSVTMIEQHPGQTPHMTGNATENVGSPTSENVDDDDSDQSDGVDESSNEAQFLDSHNPHGSLVSDDEAMQNGAQGGNESGPGDTISQTSTFATNARFVKRKRDRNDESDSPRGTSKDERILPCGILLTGSHGVYLEQHRSPKSAPFRLFCQAPLLQQIPPGLGYLKAQQRLNMLVNVPELGLVVIGSQTGRVGLFTLTFWPRKKKYGFKTELILPTKLEEDAGLRPKSPLLGIAISPVQTLSRLEMPSLDDSVSIRNASAFEDAKYRLVMMFGDLSMVAYEISRPTSQGELMLV